MIDRRRTAKQTIPLAVAALGLLGFFAVAVTVGGEVAPAFDQKLLLFMRDTGNISVPVGPSWFAEGITEITAIGGHWLITLLVIVVAGFLLAVRRHGLALYLAVTVASGALVSHFLKLYFARPRPDIVSHLDQIHTASFPSGHAMATTVAYLTLAGLVMRLCAGVRAQLYVFGFAVFMALIVGASRVYLGVHWPSDVIAGWALGAAWASLCWLIMRRLELKRGD